MWRRGFTLVELLVGIGIIAVLMGMLLPALGTARSNARTIRCLSILRSYHQANVLYHDRYGGWVPVKTGLPPADSRAGQSILPYMNWPWFEDFRSGLGTAPANQNHVPAALICPDSLA